ncbi:hypothetical protein D9M71_687770 [compost metagenome]
MALGTLRCGSRVSPAAIPISSVPEKANETASRVLAIDQKPVGNNPSRVKLPRPMLWACCTSNKPMMAPVPTTRKAITATTFTNDSQNSVSANSRTDTTLLTNTVMANNALQIHTGVSGNQRTMRMPAAVNSEPMATAQVSQ